MLLALAALLCGCRECVQPQPAGAAGLVEITCKPALEWREFPAKTLVDSSGLHFSPQILWLTLNDGKAQHHIIWAWQPGEPAPVELSEKETYTFTTEKLPDWIAIERVVRIVKGGEVIYTRPEDKK